MTVASTRIEHGPARRDAWEMRQERRSPRYTTHWDELMVVRA